MKQFTKSRSTVPKNNVRTVVMIAVGVLFVAQLIFNICLYKMYVRDSRPSVITQLIVNAVGNLHKPAPVEAKTGNVYFPDAKMMMPPPSSPALEIEYSNVGDAKTPELDITTRQLVGQATAKLWTAQSGVSRKDESLAVFNQVPNLQACARGVQVLLRPSPGIDSNKLKLQATKKLTDGRTVYIYNEPTTCHEDMSALLDTVKQIDSY